MFNSASRRTVVAAASLAAAALLAAAGCSSGDSSNTSAHGGDHSSSASSARSDFNTADVTFLQMMYPHHAQAVEMAKLAPSRSRDTQLRTLASAIEKAQSPEMAQITKLLTSFGKSDPSSTMTDHAGMSGMMSPEQMTQLERLSGLEFDRQWLQMMIEHHTGAITMANTELSGGTNSESKRLARTIAATQQNEITQMRSMLAGS